MLPELFPDLSLSLPLHLIFLPILERNTLSRVFFTKNICGLSHGNPSTVLSTACSKQPSMTVAIDTAMGRNTHRTNIRD